MKMAIYPQRDDQRKQREHEDWRGATDTEERVLRLQDKSMTSRVRCWSHGDLQKIHETLQHHEALWQVCDNRDSEVAEGTCEFRGRNILTGDTHGHTTT